MRPTFYFINSEIGSDVSHGTSLTVPLRSIREAVKRAALLPAGRPVVLVLSANVKDPMMPDLNDLIGTRPATILSEAAYRDRHQRSN
jgi:hypothetical protein